MPNHPLSAGETWAGRFTRSLFLGLIIVTSAQVISAQTSQVPSLRTREGENLSPRSVEQVIERAERYFRLGEVNLKDGLRDAARAEFDKAVETVLESGYDVRAEPRLQRYYLELVERVYRLETPHGVTATQSGNAHTSGSPSDPSAEDYVTAVINHAEAQFELGRVYLKNNKQEAAKEAFTNAMEVAGAEGTWAKDHAGLQAYRISLAERIQKLGGGGEPEPPAGFTEQRFEPSPLDELRELILTIDEQSRPSPEPCGPAGASRVELRGFRLGLMSEDVRARLPGLAVPAPDRYGQAYASANLDPRKVKDTQLKDVRRVAFSFLDGRITSVTLVYAATTDWENAAQFAKQVASSMGLTARWGRPEDAAASDEDVRQLKCESRSVIAGLMFVNRQRYPFVTARDDDASARVRGRMLAEAERKAKAALAEAERKAQEAENRRRAFKP